MTILISPLNCGIGHSTRIVPIIKYLQKHHKIIIAADGKSKIFLQKNFPSHKIIDAPNLDITYSKKGYFMPIKMFFSLPKLLIFYIKNKFWLQKFTKKHNIDMIIADNRFGFFQKKIHSIFITHQISIQIPKNFIFFSNFVQFINKINIEKFDECWIPDSPTLRISGELSNHNSLKIPVKFIGLLSRFYSQNFYDYQPKFYFFCIVSGAEPQRSIFENLLINKLQDTKHKTLIINGLSKTKKNNNPNIIIKSHLEDKTFAAAVKNSEIIIARSGYSTIMDLIALKKTAIIIPTPGQTEQEYLANYLHNKKIFFKVAQKDFNIQKTINQFVIQKNELQKNIEIIANAKNNFFTGIDVLQNKQN
jgi:uncharacterized protein (TIGR00661 family)